ncbi:hypothetical protein SAMN02799630_05585 [Paenibacillus sp. UNCCL117]|uniref:hypothetical protein n=1 Tax=unclassified Paenibacillus TaxID=185978 RepID=UPI000883C77C|nr:MULTISPECIES: hypothetical protein [unclassified Paenibacillus]SDE51485.1 hypothetical protein SAMN04488602_13145 [Paenibacillus sp. cl123]SFW67139.1 hypothetical protein SAMN02799630_05585 [Paenibacillus sp. UNCCL117]
MNKKLAMMGVGVAVGSMLLLTSVYAGVGEAPGYEAYKSAFKQTAAIGNATRQVNVALTDNGQELLSVKSVIKTGGNDRTGSASLTVTDGSEAQTIRFYSQDGKRIVKTDNSDTYKILEAGEANGRFKHARSDDKKAPDAQTVQEVEHLVDALVGNLKQAVTMTEGSGNTKELHFKLSGTQISPVVNTIGSLLIKHGASGELGERPAPLPSDTLGIDVRSIHQSLPQLTGDIKMDAVEMNATVDSDNHITNQSALIQISGKDRSGTEHDVQLQVDITLSSLGSTTPDTVDLTGKQVETIKPDEGWHKGRSFGK